MIIIKRIKMPPQYYISTDYAMVAHFFRQFCYSLIEMEKQLATIFQNQETTNVVAGP